MTCSSSRRRCDQAWLASANVSMAFYEDSANLLTGNVANQTFTGQSAGDLENWLPTSGGVTNSRVIAYLYPEGSYASADAGRLDLGVIRDSALSDTNDLRS